MVVGAKKKEREHKRAEHAANEDRTLGKVGPQVQLADFPELDHVLRRSAFGIGSLRLGSKDRLP